MSMKLRRRMSAWVCAGLVALALVAGVQKAEPEKAVSVVGREAALKLWLYDSTGARLTDVDSGTVMLYLSQTDSIGSTYWATFVAAETSWIAAVPDTSDIYTVAYASTLHAYVLIESLAIGGELVPKASIYPAAFQASSVPESALTVDTVCPRHMDTDSTFTLTLDSSSVVPAGALPADILYESEFTDGWFTPTLADTFPVWLGELLDYNGGLETTDDSLNIKLAGNTLALSTSGLKVRYLSGRRLFPFKVAGYQDRFYVAGLDSADIVLATWSPRTIGNLPYATGTGTRLMSIGAACMKADSVYICVSSGATYSAGDSCYNWIAIDDD
jgi:hypothetical protein